MVLLNTVPRNSKSIDAHIISHGGGYVTYQANTHENQSTSYKVQNLQEHSLGRLFDSGTMSAELRDPQARPYCLYGMWPAQDVVAREWDLHFSLAHEPFSEQKSRSLVIWAEECFPVFLSVFSRNFGIFLEEKKQDIRIFWENNRRNPKKQPPLRSTLRA